MLPKEVGIDLGTANTLVFVKGKGIILREPSVVAVDVKNDMILAVGKDAKDMIGKTPGSVVAVRPLKDGVIADFDITSNMLRYFIKKTVKIGFFSKPRVVICVPSGVTDVERRAVVDVARMAGIASVELMDEPMAAAIGSGMQISEPSGNMVVDIGGGTSEVAVISLGDIVAACSVRVAGDKMDESIISHIKREHKLLVGEKTAENIKISIGSVFDDGSEDSEMEIRGRNLLNGLPKNAQIKASEVRAALLKPIGDIIEAIQNTMEDTPPELLADIVERGITLTGGGALLKGLDKLIADETHMPVRAAENPMDCVADGIGKFLEASRSKKKINFFGK